LWNENPDFSSLPGMSRHRETEIKLEVRRPRVLRRRLGELGFRAVQARHFESNALFDFPDLRLWKARCLLRLRLADKQWTLTFKGAPLRSRQYKIRKEIDIGIEDGCLLREILETLGLREAFRYEKYRTVYAQGVRGKKSQGPLLFYDETPIGNYLELEGPQGWIDHLASRLGYRREDYITASYASLYRQKCHERGEKPRNMVFAVPGSKAV
jgi:adenylate cyclase class 2